MAVVELDEEGGNTNLVEPIGKDKNIMFEAGKLFSELNSKTGNGVKIDDISSALDVAFNAADEDSKGTVTKDQFKAVIAQVPFVNPIVIAEDIFGKKNELTESEFQAAKKPILDKLGKVDTNKDGYIDKSEIKFPIKPILNELVHTNLKAKEALADTLAQGDKEVKKKALKLVNDLPHLIRKADKNHDGNLSLGEAEEIFAKFREQLKPKENHEPNPQSAPHDVPAVPTNIPSILIPLVAKK